MMIQFRGARIRQSDLRFNDAGQPYTRVTFAADWSDTVREKMDWQEIPECVSGAAKLTGEIIGDYFMLIPGDPSLKDFEIKIPISSVEAFELVTRKAKEDGEMNERYLRFIVICQPPAGDQDSPGMWIENYARKCGQHEGLLKVHYAKQESLDLQDKEEDPDETSINPEFEDAPKAKRGRKAKE